MNAAQRGVLAGMMLAIVGVGAVVTRRMASAEVTVSEGWIHPHVVARAVVEPRDGIAEVRAEASGRVRTVAVRVGDTVARGQLLAELQPISEEADLAQREAEYTAATAAADAVRAGTRGDEIRAADAEVRAATAAFQLAHRNAERDRTLVAQGAVAANAGEDSANAETIARARLDSARARLSLARSGSRPEDIAAARARANAAKASTEAARRVLDRFRIVAPIAGTVLARRVDTGDTVAAEAGAPIFEIADVSQTIVRFEVEPESAPALAVGLPVTLTLPGGHGPRVNATVTRVASRLETRTIDASDAQVRAAGLVRFGWIDDAPPELGSLVGEELEASIELPPTKADLLPREAVFVQDGRAFVNVAGFWRGGTRTVELLGADESHVSVRGLGPGTRVRIP